MFKDKYGLWAFIAGASMGIGRALSLAAAPETVATSLYDGLPNGPVTWSKPLDEWITTRSLAMARDEVTLTWRALMETSTRPPERQAR